MGKGTKKKMTADYLQERAKRGDRKASERALARVPATEPEPLDRVDTKPSRRMRTGGGRPTTRKTKATDRP
jgi:hypothetical protein